MAAYWPSRASGLPPGERLLQVMPRFSDRPHLPVAVLTAADLQALGPREHTADFHCVTTWSVTGLVWTGVPLVTVLASVGLAAAPVP